MRGSKSPIITISTASEDYSIEPMSTSFTLSSAMPEVIFTVQAIDDNIFENAMESFTISISLDTPDVLAILGGAREEIVTILDNEGQLKRYTVTQQVFGSNTIVDMKGMQ